MPTQLANVIVPEVFEEYVALDTCVSTALKDSGVLVTNPFMQSQLGMGGDIINVPAWNDLVSPATINTDPNVSSDNPANVAAPNYISAVDFVARKSYLNNAWSSASLAAEIAGSDPQRRVAQRIAAYWNHVYEARLIQSLYGILLSNVANNGSDMLVDISAATTAAPITINGTQYTLPTVQRDAVIDAAFTMGDRASEVKAIAVHSAVYRTMAKNNEIEFIRDADNNILFATYAGMAILQDDNLVLPNSSYLTVLFARGAVGFAEGPSARNIPLEIFRWPQQGNGAGVEELWTRRDSIIQPFGFSFTSASVAAQSPVLSELAKASNWVRTTPERKQCPIAFLVTK